MAAAISKFHTGSKIINADTQVDIGTILHDGSLKTVNGVSLVGSGDLKPSLTLLGSRGTTGDIAITPSKGLNTVLMFEATSFSANFANIIIKLEDLANNSTYPARLYFGDFINASFHRNTAGTIITVTSIFASTSSLKVSELKVN